MHMQPRVFFTALAGFTAVSLMTMPAFAQDAPAEAPKAQATAAEATPAEAPEALPQDGAADGLASQVRDLSATVDALRQELAEVRSEIDGLRDPEPAAEKEPSEDENPKELARRLRKRASGERHSLYGDVRIGEDEIITDAFTLSGDLEVAGTVVGDAVTLNGTITVLEDGRVLGDAVSMQGDVIVEPGGVLAGEAHSLSGSVAVEPGGRVLGTSAVLHPVHQEHDLGGWLGGLFSWLYGRLVFLIAFAGAGVLVTALFQERVSRVAQALEERPGRAGLLGLAWTVGLLLVGVVTVVTIVGPLAALAVLALAWLLGFVGLCQMLGDRLGLPLPYQTHGRWLAFIIGAILVTFVGSLPWVGLIVVFAASLFGMGAVFQTRFGGR